MDIPKIQWYPGHIAKAEKKLSDVIDKVDLIIEVRDARIPLSTGHPHLNKWINNKKHILVINRSDMISSNAITSWNKWFVDKGIRASRTSITKSTLLITSDNFFSAFAIWPGYH